MITAEAFAGRTYAVYGLARSGLATAAALLASGADVVAWDAKAEARERLTSSIEGSADERSPRKTGRGTLSIANLDDFDLARVDSLVVTPGLPLNRHPISAKARAAGVEIIGDIELFARARPELPPHKVVGITGTNGKSTTTALIHHVLRSAGVATTMAGNIGLPILSQDPLPEGGVYVLELSSYQIDLTRTLDCDVAVLLNITPDHLDRYLSFEAYADSKARLFQMQQTGIAVIMDCDEPTRRISRSLASRSDSGVSSALDALGEDPIIRWTKAPGRVVRPIVAPGESPRGQSGWAQLQGPHNAQNAAAAVAACRLLGLAPHAIAEGLSTYPGLPHRMERIREKDGVLFVNDSKATNPTATAPALAAFNRIRWICGGLPKSDSLDECAPYFDHVAKAYTIGEASELFARLLSPHMKVAECGTLERAVEAAAAEAQSGETVLLSPACASFDQFRDFERRGDEFRALVGAL